MPKRPVKACLMKLLCLYTQYFVAVMESVSSCYVSRLWKLSVISFAGFPSYTKNVFPPSPTLNCCPRLSLDTVRGHEFRLVPIFGHFILNLLSTTFIDLTTPLIPRASRGLSDAVASVFQASSSYDTGMFSHVIILSTCRM